MKNSFYISETVYFVSQIAPHFINAQIAAHHSRLKQLREIQNKIE